MDELQKRCEAATAAGIDIGTMLGDEGKVAIIKSGSDFLLLPEDLSPANTLYYGTREQACAFVEGLLVGAKFVRADRGA